MGFAWNLYATGNVQYVQYLCSVNYSIHHQCTVLKLLNLIGQRLLYTVAGYMCILCSICIDTSSLTCLITTTAFLSTKSRESVNRALMQYFRQIRNIFINFQMKVFFSLIFFLIMVWYFCCSLTYILHTYSLVYACH